MFLLVMIRVLRALAIICTVVSCGLSQGTLQVPAQLTASLEILSEVTTGSSVQRNVYTGTESFSKMKNLVSATSYLSPSVTRTVVASLSPTGDSYWYDSNSTTCNSVVSSLVPRSPSHLIFLSELLLASAGSVIVPNSAYNTTRGQDCVTYRASGVPMQVLGGWSVTLGTVELAFSTTPWALLRPFGTDPYATVYPLLRVSVTATISKNSVVSTARWIYTVVDLNTNPIIGNALTPAEWCFSTTAPRVLKSYGSFPPLPSRFDAVVEAEFFESSKTTTMKLSVSAALQLARATLTSVPTGTVQFNSYDIFAVGQYGLAYQLITSTAVPSLVTTTACSKAVFGTGANVSTMYDLLLVNSVVTPRYMGRTTVRGVEADSWKGSKSGLTVQWFFSTGSTSIEGADTSAVKLLMMEVTGTGRSPFFFNHPFFPSSTAVIDTDACTTFLDATLATVCRISVPYFRHTYHFVGFSSTGDDSVFALPSECASVNQVALYVADSCDTMSGVAVAALGLLLVISGLIIGGLLMYLRMSKKANIAAGIVPTANPLPGNMM